MGTLTARFYSNLVRRYNVVFLTNLQIFVKIDREIMLHWRHYCFGGLDLPEAPLKESVAMATAKDLHSNFYLLTNPIYFQESHQIWLNIFLPLWIMGKKPQGWCWTPRLVNPISTGRGVSTPNLFFACNFLFFSQFPPNLVTSLKFNTELGKKLKFSESEARVT